MQVGATMRKGTDRGGLCLVGKVDLILVVINTMREKDKVP